MLTGSILSAEEDDNRVIYACRTKRQVFRVMEELERTHRKVRINSTYLFAKNDYCLLKEASRFPVSQESFKWLLRLQRHQQPLFLLPEHQPGEQGGG